MAKAKATTSTNIPQTLGADQAPIKTPEIIPIQSPVSLPTIQVPALSL